MCEINTFVYGKIVLGKTAATVTVKFNTVGRVLIASIY